jgi:integrating conjugative element protein (TIGR03749 family)
MRISNTLLLIFITTGLLFTLQDSQADDAPLPLTPKQINKLQHLFTPTSIDSVPNFQISSPHEHVVWSQAPIDVILPVGKERMVSFPASVQFGYDKSVLPDSALRIQNNDHTLYLTAKTEFSPQRVQVKCNDSGKIILLNLSARKGASDTPLDVILAQPPNTTTIQLKNNTNVSSDNNVPSPLASSLSDDTVSYITLIRFATQQLYAPKRLLIQPPSIFRTPMHVKKTAPLFRDGSVIAMPLASWRGGDVTVTAVLLRNQLHQALTLDARNLCGDWRAASFFPQTILAPAGQRQDSTTVFLVANRSFADALEVCTRGF